MKDIDKIKEETIKMFGNDPMHNSSCYKMLAELFDRLEGSLPEDCQKEKLFSLEAAQLFNFVVGSNGNAIEIHSKTTGSKYSDRNLILRLRLDKDGRIVVDSEKLWKLASIMEAKENRQKH